MTPTPRFRRARFDGQAETHDRRTGIPDPQCREVAQAVASLVDAGEGERLLDLGAGTGLPGAWFPEVGFRTLGLDASAPMLGRFAERRPGSRGPALLLRADVDRPWPLADGVVGVVFSSRAAHLFDREHLVAEALRVAKPGAWWVLGRVQREEGSLRRRLRDEMRARLVARGYEPADAPQQQRGILDELRRRGATPFPPRVAAVWQARHSAAGVLDAWSATAGLGGCALERRVKDDILEELWDWSRDHVESAQALVSSEERFVLEGVRLEAS